MKPRHAVIALALVWTACGDDPPDADAGEAMVDAGGTPTDAGETPTDAGEAPTDAGETPTDAGGAPTDAGPSLASLVSQPGCFFTVSGPDDTMRIDFGEVGTAYADLTIEVDVTVSDWRRDLFDRPVLSHNLLNLFRNASMSRERYIGGFGVLIRTSGGLRPDTMFFARVDLEPRPPGMGYTSYTAFRDRAPWETGARYHLSMRFDTAAQRQILDVTRGGAPFSHAEGDIAYFEPGLTDDGWYLELGAEDTTFRDVNPVGWELCDLTVVGTELE